jgi:hypothetical protein
VWLAPGRIAALQPAGPWGGLPGKVQAEVAQGRSGRFRGGHGPCSSARHISASEEEAVPDLAYVLTSVVFFGLAWAYALACERL